MGFADQRASNWLKGWSCNWVSYWVMRIAGKSIDFRFFWIEFLSIVNNFKILISVIILLSQKGYKFIKKNNLILLKIVAKLTSWPLSLLFIWRHLVWNVCHNSVSLKISTSNLSVSSVCPPSIQKKKVKKLWFLANSVW